MKFVQLLLLAMVVAMGTVVAARAESRTVESCDLQLAFEYPAEWGDVQITDYRGGTGADSLLGASGLRWKLEFTGFSGRSPFSIALRVGEFVDDQAYRVVWYEGWADSTRYSELRDQILRSPETQVAGAPATVVEEYFEPAGIAQQTITWICANVVYELTVGADVSDFETVRYGGLGLSRLSELNPEDARLNRFLEEIGRLLGSARCVGDS